MFEEQEPEAVEFKKYLSAYDKTLELIIEVHNRHLSFKKYKGHETARQVRNAIRELIRVQRTMSVTAWSAYKENQEISKFIKRNAKKNKLKYKSKKAQLETK